MLDQVSSSPSTRTLPAWREPWAAAALRLLTLTLTHYAQWNGGARNRVSGQRSRLERRNRRRQQNLAAVGGDDACDRAIVLERCAVSRARAMPHVPAPGEPHLSALARLHSRAEPAARAPPIQERTQ